MRYLKQYIKNDIVYFINDETVDDSLLMSIINDTNFSRKVAIDMINVKNINSALFIKYLKNNKYKLFNLSNELLAYLSLVIKNGMIHSYMSFKDLKNNKRELIVRKFTVA